MNLILGGGLIGLLARDILGPKWTIIPYGKSRFYSFSPPLADNFIIHDDEISEYTKLYVGSPPLFIKSMYSFGGQLTSNHAICVDEYLNKVYGPSVPRHAKAMMSKRFEFFAYGDCADIYRTLQEKYQSELVANSEKYGVITKIQDDHTIITSTGVRLEYNKILSTIPIDVLVGYFGEKVALNSKDMWCYHLETDKLDLENSQIVYAVDPDIEFYKVNSLGNAQYVFYAGKRIEKPGAYFMMFIKDFHLIQETTIPQAVPCGNIPNIDVNSRGIYCIGSSAVWDDFLDVGSCIKRIILHLS